MNKVSAIQIGQMLKLASANMRALNEENIELRTKVADYEKRSRVEKLAALMEEKGLQPDLSQEEKVAGLLQREDLAVVEEAVSLNAPQLKMASFRENGRVLVEDSTTEDSSDRAADYFASNLASI